MSLAKCTAIYCDTSILYCDTYWILSGCWKWFLSRYWYIHPACTILNFLHWCFSFQRNLRCQQPKYIQLDRFSDNYLSKFMLGTVETTQSFFPTVVSITLDNIHVLWYTVLQFGCFSIPHHKIYHSMPIYQFIITPVMKKEKQYL